MEMLRARVETLKMDGGSVWMDVVSLFSTRVTEDGHTLNPPGRRSGRLDAQPCAERVQHHV